MKHFILLFIFSGIFFPLVSKAQGQLNPVKWEYSFERKSPTEGTIIIKATIDDKWHIYSQMQPDEGPIPTSFKYTPAAGYELVGKTDEPTAVKSYSEVFGTEVISFEKQVTFTQNVKLTTDKPFLISGELEFMSCNDNMCLPPRTLSFSINVPAK